MSLPLLLAYGISLTQVAEMAYHIWMIQAAVDCQAHFFLLFGLAAVRDSRQLHTFGVRNLEGKMEGVNTTYEFVYLAVLTCPTATDSIIYILPAWSYLYFSFPNGINSLQRVLTTRLLEEASRKFRIARKPEPESTSKGQKIVYGAYIWKP